MKETDLQSKCVDAMRELGAFAQKCSNRFLIGVPDLLCQLPTFPTSYWEVKRGGNAIQGFEPTPKQKLWMRDFTRAGGFCGTIYFVTVGNDMAVAVKPVTYFDLDDFSIKWKVPEVEYVILPRGCKMAPFKEELVRVHVARK